MSSNSSTEPESASERVGRIVELVENVLQHLPYRDILSAQYVCHQWKDIINTSKIVRAQIFLAPHRLTSHIVAASSALLSPFRSALTSMESPWGKYKDLLSGC